MTEQEWLSSTNPRAMLWFLRGKTTERKLRLFACGFPRQFWHLFHDESSRLAIEVAEDFADGKATQEVLAASNARSEAIVDWNKLVPDWEGTWSVHPLAKMAALASRAKAQDGAWLVPQMISDIQYFGGAEPAYPESKLEAAAQDFQRFIPLLHCVFGNPFLPSQANPSVVLGQADYLRIHKIAQAIYDDRAFDRMPILADALEDAGCDDSDILTHCRSGSVHVRGCWVIDFLLNKK